MMIATIAAAAMIAATPEWLVQKNKDLSTAFNTKQWDAIQSAYHPDSMLVANSQKIYGGSDIASFFKNIYTQGLVSHIELTTQFSFFETDSLLHTVLLAEDAPDSVDFTVYTRWFNSSGTWLKAFEAVLRPRTDATRKGCEKLSPVAVPAWMTAQQTKFSSCLTSQNASCAQSLYHVGALQIPSDCASFVQYGDLPNYFQNSSAGITFAEAQPSHVFKESDTLYHEVGDLITNTVSSSYYNRWVLDGGVWSIAVGIASVLPGGHC
eukprot:TRINITY_DN20056_c0_g2_i1.p2 TRINITY_DN20056_c0_g2~~TRINITY_DN20056_c0_g2_i1.p2  ORF type:complete len:265 (+),score=129.81 TRINITY_DN20056_c0_g2_i1:78-872(+)